LCRARKSDVLLHLERHRLAFAEDPSNENRRFLRTRVRRELMPLLTQLSPQITGHLCALADALGTTEAIARSQVPDLDAVRDERGVALSLNRAQRGLVGRALALGQRSARVSLAGGRELTLDPVTLLPTLLAARPRKR
jgi:tRNA(Ile)-lysidine synthase